MPLFVTILVPILICCIFFLGFLVHDQLHFRSTAMGFKMYSLSFPTIALLDGLLDQVDSQNLLPHSKYEVVHEW